MCTERCNGILAFQVQCWTTIIVHNDSVYIACTHAFGFTRVQIYIALNGTVPGIKVKIINPYTFNIYVLQLVLQTWGFLKT